MATYSYPFTAFVESGAEDNYPIEDGVSEVTVAALQGDCYININSGGPPALDAMTASNHWGGFILMQGQSYTWNLTQGNCPNGKLYVGPVTPSSGSCTVSFMGIANS